jgi:CheY-like chemotaxis protein
MEPDDATTKPLTILLVDDNPHLLKLMTLGLPDLGNYTVETAEDGIEGLTKCLELHPDCMVIDVMMPGLDGYQLVRTLRGDPETAGTPLILLTARVQDRDQFEGLASGADRYLCKPVMPSELSVAIADAIRVGAAERLKNAAILADTPFEEQ